MPQKNAKKNAKSKLKCILLIENLYSCTLASWSIFHSDPPVKNHRRMMIYVEKTEL